MHGRTESVEVYAECFDQQPSLWTFEPAERSSHILVEFFLGVTEDSAPSDREPEPRNRVYLEDLYDYGFGERDGRLVAYRHQPEVEACYDELLRKHDPVDGHLTLGLEYDSDGQTTSVRLDFSDARLIPFVECTIEAARTWRFRPADEARRSMNLQYELRSTVPPRRAKAG